MVTRAVPGSAGVPTRGEPARPEPGDQRQLREGLGVVHQGGPAVDAGLPDRRQLARPVGHHRCSGIGPARSPRTRCTGPAPRPRSISHRRLGRSASAEPQGPLRRGALVHGQHDPVRADGRGRGQRAVDHQMRRSVRSAPGPCAEVGSPSQQLATTTAGNRDSRPPAATAATFRPVGNPAPPRPSRPAASSICAELPAPNAAGTGPSRARCSTHDEPGRAGSSRSVAGGLGAQRVASRCLVEVRLSG